MKKFSRIFFSLIITLFATSMIFSFSAVNVKATDHVVDPGGSKIINGGPSTASILMYKVTVYIDTDKNATKESAYSNFEKKAIAYYYKSSTVTKEINSYVGSKTKFDYAHNPHSLNATTIKAFDSAGKLIYKSNLPSVSILDPEKVSVAHPAIEAYFAKDEDTRYRFAKEVCSKSGINIEKSDTWVLTVEPTVRSVLYGRIYYYTPTEYAIALKFKDKKEGFGSFDFYNYTARGYGLTLNRSGSLSYIVNGEWFGLGSGTVRNTWKEIDEETDFNDQIGNYIKYAGVFVWFSGAFEKSDYSLGEVQNMEEFENATKELKVKVKRTNPTKDETVSVTLDLPDTYGAKITENEATQSVTFPKGVAEKTVSWKINVGSYGDYSSNRSYKYNIEIETSEETETYEMMKNNTLEGTITLKRDFQVTMVSLNTGECFENENVKVSFTVKNVNPYKEYKEIPVTVYFLYGGKKIEIGEVEIDLGNEEKKSGSCMINVGCVTENADQYDSVVVVLNSYNEKAERGSRYSEPDMSNNRGSVGIKVKRDINLSVSIVDRDDWDDLIGNAPSKVKDTGTTQAVTTVAVKNHSRFNLYEGNSMNDIVTVSFFVNNKKIGSQAVVIPRYGSNLVWFKWNVPEGSSVTLRAEIEWNINQENSTSPYADNKVSLVKSVATVKEFDTPDTELLLEHGSNKNYMTAAGYSRFKPSVAKWSQWVCDDKGTFIRIDYAMTGDSALTLTPMISAEYYNGNTIASGSAISAVFSYTVRTECSEAGYDVSKDDYTYAQNVVAMFPEFQYASKGDCRTMYLVKEDGKLSNATFQFEKNPYIKDKQRVHFTPSNMPDGEYKVGVVASQMWTPAGPIYVNASSSLMINGSVYGDWNPNASVKEG